MRDLEIENAIVRSAQLKMERGMLTAWVHLTFNSGGCGYGGYILSQPNQDHRESDYDGAGKLLELLKFFGVDELSKIEGKPVRAAHEGLGGGVDHLIDHLDDSKTFTWKLEEKV